MDREFPIDLSNTNLAFASLQGLDFSNVTFDGALMCRMFLKQTNFSDASVVGTDLRFTEMVGARGLFAFQLLEADSLYKTNVPIDLISDSRIRVRLLTEYEVVELPE